MGTKFKKVQEEIAYYKNMELAGRLTEDSKELMEELETLMDYAQSSLQLKEKEEINFGDWFYKNCEETDSYDCLKYKNKYYSIIELEDVYESIKDDL